MCFGQPIVRAILELGLVRTKMNSFTFLSSLEENSLSLVQGF